MVILTRMFTRGAGERYWSVNRSSDPNLTVEENQRIWEELSAKEDEMKYQEFVQRLNFNKRVVSLTLLTC